MKFSVVIPVKNHNNTLPSTIESVVNQNYADLELVICNLSRDREVKKIVDKLNDNNVIYAEAPRELEFSDDWEFALSHASGDYITFLGDDDAMVPSGLNAAASIISANSVDALVWRKFNYNWPDHVVEHKRNLFKGSASQSMRFVDSKKALNLMRNCFMGYNELPCIYNSFVKKSIIDEIRSASFNNKFFGGALPDVYSGIVVASTINYYIYLNAPITLNAASAKSTGVLQASDVLTNKQKKEIRAVLQSGSKYDERIGEFNTSIKAISLGEYLLAQSNLTGFRGKRPNWLFFVLALRRELRYSTNPERIMKGIIHTQKVTKTFIPLPKLPQRTKSRPSMDLSCNIRLPNHINQPHLAAELLNSLPITNENIKILSLRSETSNLISNILSSLINLFKIYLTRYDVDN